jgi:hypothetical protein
MKKSLVLISAFCLVIFLAASARVSADNSSASPSATPGATSTGAKHTVKKKKTSSQPTPQAVVPTPQAAAVPALAPKAVVPQASKIFSENERLYDQVGASGDLQKAVALAAKTLGSSTMKYDRSVFLWLKNVTSGNDEARESAYIRFGLDGVAYGGPRKPWIVLTGTVYDQSGSELKAGSPVEVAVDFRDIKVDYEGTKLGEVNKGNDIADQVYDILSAHSPYQWVLMVQDQVKDSKDPSLTPAFVVKAKEGYSFLQAMESHSHSTTPSR